MQQIFTDYNKGGACLPCRHEAYPACRLAGYGLRGNIHAAFRPMHFTIGRVRIAHADLFYRFARSTIRVRDAHWTLCGYWQIGFARTIGIGRSHYVRASRLFVLVVRGRLVFSSEVRWLQIYQTLTQLLLLAYLVWPIFSGTVSAHNRHLNPQLTTRVMSV
jgi:hypothetical protein